MKWKIILRFEMYGAKTRKGKMPTLRNRKIIPLLKKMGLEQTDAESWCGNDVKLNVAAENLPEIMRAFADPRSTPNTSGDLGHLLLYIERS